MYRAPGSENNNPSTDNKLLRNVVAYDHPLSADMSINKAYKPCTEDSCYHDLRCGHRVKTAYPEPCGDSCNNDMTGPLYFCPECIERDVRAAIGLEGLSFDAQRDDDLVMTDIRLGQRDRVDQAAEKIINEMLGKGNYRRCKIVPKMINPTLQMFEQIAHDNGMNLLKPEPEKPRKRPVHGSRLLYPNRQHVHGVEAQFKKHAEGTTPRPGSYEITPSHEQKESNETNPLPEIRQSGVVIDAESKAIEEDEVARAVRKALDILSLRFAALDT